MFLRCIVRKQDRDSRSFSGLFTEAHALREARDLEAHEEAQLQNFLTWMKENLQEPPCLAEPGNGRAICWFKDTAGTPLEKAWEVASLLRERGVPIEMIKSESPGKIIYEDDWQVAAKPRKKNRIRR